jgi:DegV family protein with EDD domain
MAPVRVVTDSAADLEQGVTGKYGIAVVPLDVRLGELGPDVTRTWSADEFWQHCANSFAFPETSAPSPGAFSAAFSAAADDGATGVVCVTLSSRLSATYQAALAGAEDVGDRLPVRVIDSLTVTMGQGLLVISAAEAAGAGGSLDEVAAGVEEARGKVHVYGSLDTLDNLRHGGRIGAAAAFFGSLLSVKPIIEVRDGVVEAESRPRTRSRSLEQLASKVPDAELLDQLAVVHAAAPDVGRVVDILASRFPRDDMLVGHIGPVIGSHAGPRSVGVCFKLK